MSNFYVRSRPTANWTTGAKALGAKVVSTSTTQGLGMCFEVTTAGTSSGSEPAWVYTIGSTTTDAGGVVWTCRGGAGIWLALKSYGLGDRVCRVSQTSMNVANSAIWECTTAGTSGGTEPTWPTTITAGTTTQTDGGVTWTARACTTWDNSHPFLKSLIADRANNATIRVQAGDTVYVSNVHAESWTPGAFTSNFYDFPGSAASPLRVLCAVDTGQPQPPTTLATTATVTLTGGNSSTLLLAGPVYCYGVTFACTGTSGNCGIGILANGSSASSYLQIRMESCGINIGTSNSSVMAFGANSGTVATAPSIELINCTLTFGSTLQSIIYQSTFRFRMKGGAIAGTVPTGGLISLNTGAITSGTAEFDGVDLSPLGSGSIMSGTWQPSSVNFLFRNCKLGASFSWAPAFNASYGWCHTSLDAINCDSAGTNYILRRENQMGRTLPETTIIRSGGASDGTTGLSHKIVTSTVTRWDFAYANFELAAWNDNSGSSKTATVEILADTVTNLNNDDIWMEVEYQGASGNPRSSFLNCTKANILAANAAIPSSSASWTTTGITHPNAMKLQVVFTPQMKGWVIARVYVAKTSQTVYVDPMITIT